MDCEDHKSLFRDFEARSGEELRHIELSVQDSVLKVRGGDFLTFGIVKGVGIQDHPSRFALATNPWFDLELIKFWKHRCISEHRQSCGNPWRIRQIKPAWLIDTQRSCLVPGNKGGAYICLSYRWGKSPAYRTTKAALPDLQKPGSLDRTDIKAQLPPVVSQAMQLVEAMDERFLWVDTLCIPQDDEDFKVAEMDRMGEIYGSAFLTIIAAEGDGDHKIPGLPGAAPRISNQDLFKFAHHTLIQVPGGRSLDKTFRTAYAKRGWTYQEYQMSARKLIFSDSRVHWDCGCDAWDEERPMYKDLYCKEDTAEYLTAHGLPDLETIWSVVRGFNHRDLTHDSDALRAISGILAVLNRGFDGGFLFGLPIMFFDLALCWYPHDELRRRVTPNEQSETKTARLPSWSWVGWHGPVHCCSDEIGFDVFSIGASQTHPITTWHASHAPHGHQRRPIDSWFHRRPLHCDPYAPPSGWTREDLVHSPHGFLDPRDQKPHGCGEHVFRHNSVPHKTFWYHFPTSETVSGINSTAIPSQMPNDLSRVSVDNNGVGTRIELAAESNLKEQRTGEK
ncbi:heterokaryon incompatibility protein-domain-containing protein [Apiospora sp. TS-2023a]